MLGAVFSVKNTADVTTKHGFVGAGFKPAQGVSETNQVNFPPQGGFETRPYPDISSSAALRQTIFPFVRSRTTTEQAPLPGLSLDQPGLQQHRKA